ncbi:MAG: MBL fold metallo-hydrolase [Acidobacteriota bacterium]
MILSVLGSGSGGNCTYLATEKTCVLVDLGFGWRSLNRRLQEAELPDRKIDAVLFTHGHSDHTRGISSFRSRSDAPLFVNEGTQAEVQGLSSMERRENFCSNSPFVIGDLEIEAFPVSHDAAEPVGFRFSGEGIEGALITDLGEMNDPVRAKLRGCDWLIVESNHDEQMLKIGPYPWELKQRVLSRLGHLSNQDLSSFLTDHFDGQASHILLAHLSRQNNDPDVALEHASRALSQRFSGSAADHQVHLTHQKGPSVVLHF